MKRYFIQTFRGHKFYPLEKDPGIICSTDIVHALSNLCRYTGHSKFFYSVAEHSILLSSNVKDEHKQWALLHDAAEAYIGDISRPLKYALLEYTSIIEQVEEQLLQNIAAVFNLSYPIPQEVVDADISLCYIEKKYLFDKDIPWEGYMFKGLTTDEIAPYGIEPETIEKLFKSRWKDLEIKWID